MKKSIRQKIEERRTAEVQTKAVYGSLFEALDAQDPDALANWFSLLASEGESVG